MVAQLAIRLDRVIQKQIEVNAAALPLIGFGTVLSAFFRPLAAAPLVLDWAVWVLLRS